MWSMEDSALVGDIYACEEWSNMMARIQDTYVAYAEEEGCRCQNTKTFGETF